MISLSGIGTWFETSSHSNGAALVRRIADLTDADPGPGGSRPNLDLRAGGVQVWIPDETGLTAARLALAQSISTVARELGLVADPSVPQDLEWGIETLDKPILRPFWQTLLGYEDTELDDLLDPLRRDPRVWFYAAAPRPLRNRIHFDVAVPREVAEERVAAVRAIGAGEDYASDHGNVLLTDAEGESGRLHSGRWVRRGGRDIGLAAAVRRRGLYPTGDPRLAAELATGVAEVADAAGLPLMIDLRAEGVMIDTGKDQWEDQRFGETARRVQAIARDLGLTADPSRLRFFQVCIDAVDIPAVRAFWRAALGYENDPREFVTDICDPRRLNNPMIFQQLDPTDTARREQRNRIHLDLYLPDDQVAARIEAALAAGGRFTRGDGGTIADPEGNEIDIGKTIVDPPSHDHEEP